MKRHLNGGSRRLPCSSCKKDSIVLSCLCDRRPCPRCSRPMEIHEYFARSKKLIRFDRDIITICVEDYVEPSQEPKPA